MDLKENKFMNFKEFFFFQFYLILPYKLHIEMLLRLHSQTEINEQKNDFQ